MYPLIVYLVRRLRPRAGWPVALLLLVAAGSPALAAGGASLPLPDGLIVTAGLAGAAIGLRVSGLRRRWLALYGLVAAALGGALLLAACEALPPLGLLWRDGVAIAARAGAWVGGADWAPPELLAPRFLQLSLPRAWRALVEAPQAGEAGAALIVAGLALATTLAGALALGWAGAAGGHILAWGAPLTAAMALTTILGGGGGVGLVLGLAALLALAAVAGHKARERGWEAAEIAYSEELRWDVLGWGGALAAAALMLALVIPTSLPRLPTPAVIGPEGLPSGLAAIEERVERGAEPAPLDIGLSQLPAVNLGVSLSDEPPETVALRVHMAAPFEPGLWPRYWRARVLNIYTGRSWWADARVGPPLRPVEGLAAIDGAILQEIELVERESPVLVALPDVVALDMPAREERLPDGALAAIIAEPGGRRYAAVSVPQALAPPAPPPQGAPPVPPPDAGTLGLPAGVPPRVRDLARSVAGGATSPLEQALAVEGYLRGLPYAYEVQPIPAGGDAVDQFLFEMRQGYCTYYASAMAVMARSLGIPARVAVGYATGEWDPALGVYVVREADAHAWPELLIGGSWVPFEPTPVRPLPARAGGAPEPVPAPQPAPAARPDLWASTRALAPAAGALGLVALTAGGAWLAVRRLRVPPLARAQLRLERLGARAGVAWPAGATLHEYGALLAARGVAGAGELAELVGLIEAARYGGRPLSAAQAARLQDAARGLRAGGRRGG